jgi:hypothetical protein
MTTANQPAPFQRFYIIFAKLWQLTKNSPADEAKTLVDLLDEKLLDLASKDTQFWFPNPFGGAVLVNSIDEAMDGAKNLLNAMAKNGVEVSVAVTYGRCDRIANVNRWNATAKSMNLAARIATVDSLKSRVGVDPVVKNEACSARTKYGEFFGPVLDEKIKETQFKYHLVVESEYQGQPSPVRSAKPAVVPDVFTADIVLFDIEKFSEKSAEDQSTVVDDLSRCVELSLSGVGAVNASFEPAGDGGYVTFLVPGNDPAPKTLSFAKQLSECCRSKRVPLRIGISTGQVAKGEVRSAVGGSILQADAVSGLASPEAIAVTNRFWGDLPQFYKKEWQESRLKDDTTLICLPGISRGEHVSPFITARFFKPKLSDFDVVEFVRRYWGLDLEPTAAALISGLEIQAIIRNSQRWLVRRGVTHWLLREILRKSVAQISVLTSKHELLHWLNIQNFPTQPALKSRTTEGSFFVCPDGNGPAYELYIFEHGLIPYTKSNAVSARPALAELIIKLASVSHLLQNSNGALANALESRFGSQHPYGKIQEIREKMSVIYSRGEQREDLKMVFAAIEKCLVDRPSIEKAVAQQPFRLVHGDLTENNVHLKADTMWLFDWDTVKWRRSANLDLGFALVRLAIPRRDESSLQIQNDEVKAAKELLARIRKIWPSGLPSELYPTDEAMRVALDEVRLEFAIRMVEYFEVLSTMPDYPVDISYVRRCNPERAETLKTRLFWKS